MGSGEWSFYAENGKETKGIYENGNKLSGEFWINVKQDSFGWKETEDEDVSKSVFRGLFSYDDGLWNGLGVLYWENGNKRGEGLYEDGKHGGYYKRFYSSGKLMWDGNYVDGKKEGKLVEYDGDGNIIDEDIWKDGECVEKCEGDE